MSKRLTIVLSLSSRIDADVRRWLARIALSLAVALLAGTLAFLVARAVTDVTLFAQQQQFLSEAASALRGGIPELANSNLREARLRVQRLDAQNEQLSLLIGFAIAALSAVASYLWMERRHGTTFAHPPR
ncbi:MAG TPA: hypothetical protein VGJ87_17350 [Roseiflexaceae bacterium]|jgi:hypothetical protein